MADFLDDIGYDSDSDSFIWVGDDATTAAPRPDESPATPDPVPAAMPPVLRIQSIERTLNSNGTIQHRAVLFHQKCSVCVDWVSQHTDTRLHRYGLVSIRHALSASCTDGALRIDRLLPADRPQPSINLFDTILPEWLEDRELAARAATLWEQLPRPLAHLVNAVFWESHRFHRFILGPSSMADHHNGWHGNFRHSVEVAEHAQEIGQRSSLANTSLLIAAGLLHDAGKSDEYRFDRVSKHFRLSMRGELIGHRDTLIEWLAVARASGVIIGDDLYLSLLHTLNASKGAPAYLGLRDPRCVEAEILSMADRLSGHEDIHQRCAPKENRAGFGHFNRRIGHRTYVTPRMDVTTHTPFALGGH